MLCLKRALRIANAAQQMANASRGSSGSVVLFIEILNKWWFQLFYLLKNLFICRPFYISKWSSIWNASSLCIIRYLYFYEKGVLQVTIDSIQSLIELIKQEMSGENTTADPSTDAFFASTLRYIQFQKDKGGVVAEKYSPIKAEFAETSWTGKFFRNTPIKFYHFNLVFVFSTPCTSREWISDQFMISPK